MISVSSVIKSTLSFATIIVVAEITQQSMRNYLKSPDYVTWTFDFLVLRLTFYYGLYSGVIVNIWMEMLEKWYPGKRMSVVLKKVTLDHIICTSLMISQFIIGNYFSAVLVQTFHYSVSPRISQQVHRSASYNVGFFKKRMRPRKGEYLSPLKPVLANMILAKNRSLDLRLSRNSSKCNFYTILNPCA